MLLGWPKAILVPKNNFFYLFVTSINFQDILLNLLKLQKWWLFLISTIHHYV